MPRAPHARNEFLRGRAWGETHSCSSIPCTSAPRHAPPNASPCTSKPLAPCASNRLSGSSWCDYVLNKRLQLNRPFALLGYPLPYEQVDQPMQMAKWAAWAVLPHRLTSSHLRLSPPPLTISPLLSSPLSSSSPLLLSPPLSSSSPLLLSPLLRSSLLRSSSSSHASHPPPPTPLAYPVTLPTLSSPSPRWTVPCCGPKGPVLSAALSQRAIQPVGPMGAPHLLCTKETDCSSCFIQVSARHRGGASSLALQVLDLQR